MLYLLNLFFVEPSITINSYASILSYFVSCYMKTAMLETRMLYIKTAMLEFCLLYTKHSYARILYVVYKTQLC